MYAPSKMHDSIARRKTAPRIEFRVNKKAYVEGIEEEGGRKGDGRTDDDGARGGRLADREAGGEPPPDPVRNVKSSVELGETADGRLYVKSVKVPGENPEMAAAGALRAYQNVRNAIDGPEARLAEAKRLVAADADWRSEGDGC